MEIIVVLIIVALALACLHAILWRVLPGSRDRTLPGYRDPLVLHLSVIVGFIGVLLLVLRK
jgi:hypothetical protein